jgi:hypothetical protein
MLGASHHHPLQGPYDFNVLVRFFSTLLDLFSLLARLESEKGLKILLLRSLFASCNGHELALLDFPDGRRGTSAGSLLLKEAPP